MSDKSFEHLKARRYQEALGAGLEALKLDPKHPYAQYNAGMAYLELGEPCMAISLLLQTFERQGRWEPALGLSRAYAAAFNATRATYYATVAGGLGAPQAEVQAAQSGAEALRKGTPPADLQKGSRVTLEDGNVTFYLYPEADKKGCFGKVFTLYALTKDGQSFKLPLGSVWDGEGLWKLTAAGQGRYWLRTPPQLYAYVSPASAWRLVTFQDGRLSVAMFAGADTVDSQSEPVLENQTLTAARQNTASGATTWVTRYTLGGSPPIFAKSDEEEQGEGVVQAIGEKITIEMRAEVGGVRPEHLIYTQPLTGKVLVLKGGRPVPLTDVKVGSMVVVRESEKSGLIIELR